MKNTQFITDYGLFASICVTIVGIGVFSYPKDLTAILGTDGWLTTILVGLISFIMLYAICYTIKINNYNKFCKILTENFGNILGKVISILFSMYIIMMGGLGLRLFVEIVKMYLLEKTPTEFLVLITVLTGIYLIRGEIESVVKFNEIAFWLKFLPIIIIIPFTFGKADFTNIFPVLTSSPLLYIKSLRYTMFSFAGFEIAYLIIPFAKNRNSIKKIASRSMIFTVAFYLIMFIFVLAVFGKEQTHILLWPIISMVKVIDIPGSFIERWEGIIMALWIIFYFTSFVNLFFFSSDIIRDTFKLGDIKLSSFIVSPFIFIIALYPQNIAQLFNIQNIIIPMVTGICIIVMPLVLLAVSKLRRKESAKNEI